MLVSENGYISTTNSDYVRLVLHWYYGARLLFYLPHSADILSKSRWAIINIWRPIGHAVTRENLAITDAARFPILICGLCWGSSDVLTTMKQ